MVDLDGNLSALLIHCVDEGLTADYPSSHQPLLPLLRNNILAEDYLGGSEGVAGRADDQLGGDDLSEIPEIAGGERSKGSNMRRRRRRR